MRPFDKINGDALLGMWVAPSLGGGEDRSSSSKEKPPIWGRITRHVKRNCQCVRFGHRFGDFSRFRLGCD